jgi:fatty aldehyde-generating acyl-ACP reductase
VSAGSPTLAIVGHLESLEAYRSALEAARGAGLPPVGLEAVRSALAHMDATPLCDFVLRSPRGIERRARYIDIGLVIEPGWSAVRGALARVRRACAEARDCGARLGALGGFSSIVAEHERADLEQEFGIPFTTGNTLTAATIAAQVLALDPGGEARVTVVGAAGDVGSGVCRLLSPRATPLTLVGRSQRPLEALAAELGTARVCSWEDAAGATEIAVLVASAGIGELRLNALAASAVVLDGGHPPNAEAVPGVRYALAGRVVFETPPECDLPVILSDRYPPGQGHACVAEGVVLALEGRFESFSCGRGHIRRERAAEILRLAERHGVRPAPFCLRSGAA